LPYVKDIVTDKAKPAINICCYKTFWRRRWRYYLKHGDDERSLVYSKPTYPGIKEMMRDIAIVRGKNQWPITFADTVLSAEQVAEMQREIAAPGIPPKK